MKSRNEKQYKNLKYKQKVNIISIADKVLCEL